MLYVLLKAESRINLRAPSHDSFCEVNLNLLISIIYMVTKKRNYVTQPLVTSISAKIRQSVCERRLIRVLRRRDEI